MIDNKNGWWDTEEELLGSCKQPPNEGIWYHSGKDGLWYNDRAKTTAVNEVCIDGVSYIRESCC